MSYETLVRIQGLLKRLWLPYPVFWIVDSATGERKGKLAGIGWRGHSITRKP